jgi:hypothetical protein
MPILGTIASSFLANADDMVLISYQTNTSTQANLEFTSIPTTYKHLRLLTMLKDTDGTGTTRCKVAFNNDTTSGNYYNGGMQFLNTIGGNGSSFREAANNSFGLGTRSAQSMFGVNVIDIYDYANTSYKKLCGVRAVSSTSNDAHADHFSVFWNNTSAITKISMFTEASSYVWAANCQAWLYGIKG